MMNLISLNLSKFHFLHLVASNKYDNNPLFAPYIFSKIVNFFFKLTIFYI
jgi:hypothetical protein